MNVLTSLILGVVEGLTEFLPVSSTFHLILTSRLLNLAQTEYLKLFEVVIQTGAILSIISLYKDQLFSNKYLQKNLYLSFLPTVVVGSILYKIIKGYFFENLLLQIVVFFSVGILFILTERLLTRRGTAMFLPQHKVNSRHAVIIGLFQAMSVVPGFSRSGSIIVGMLLLGYSRPAAAEYAFMLSLPTILAATALDLSQNLVLLSTLTFEQYLYIGIGLISAYISALWVMRWLIDYLTRHTLEVFGYYRIILSMLIMLFLG